MTTNDNANPPAEETATETTAVSTKASYRLQVWQEMDKKRLVRFPRPCRGRVPNFVDRMAAAEKLESEEAFKNAKVIMVNLDKPQEAVRIAILESGKTLLVPVARLEDGHMMKVCPPTDAKKDMLKVASSVKGINEFGKVVPLDEKIHIDIVVTGSVAVSKEGYRIGKGGGYSDLDYAILAETGKVTKDTLIVTTVDDEQVFDTLPHELFQSYDVPVDLIVTPTQVIEVKPRLPRPEGIQWQLLSNRRLEQIPLLKTLRSKEIENGKECPIKEADSDLEDRPRPYFRRYQNYRRRPQQYRRPREQNHSESNRESNRDSSPNRVSRTFRRQRPNGYNTDKGQKIQRPRRDDIRPERKMNGENKENHQDKQPRKQMRPFIKTKLDFDFSVKVGNISSTVRVRDLKAALVEKGVRPRTITWRGYKGFAMLHFAKIKAEPEQPTAVDDVIASLQGLKVKFEDEAEVKETLLSIEPAKKITRIENAGVTSV